MERQSLRFEEQALLSLCSDALVLKSLSTPMALDLLEAICRLRGLEPESGAAYYRLVNGYKLVAATALYGMLSSVTTYPMTLGLEEDRKVLDWWMFHQSNGGGALHAAFTDKESKQARIASRIDEAISAIPIADSWHEMINALGDAGSFGEVLWKSALAGSVSMFNQTDAQVDIEHALQGGAVERLFDYLDGRVLRSAYRYIWRGTNQRRQTPRQSQGASLGDIETHIDQRLLFNYTGSLMPNWESGVIAAMVITLRELNIIDSTEDMYKLLGQTMNSPLGMKTFLNQIIGGRFPSLMLGLKLPLSLSIQDWEFLQSTTRLVSAKDTLAALLGNESRVVASNDPTDAMDFEIVMVGVTSVLKDAGTIEVIRIQHSDTSDGLTWYSIAVRVPRYGLMSNLSKWWVFFKIYGEGMPEPDLTVAANHTIRTIERFKDRVALTELQGIGTQELLDICEPGTWRYLLKKAERLVDVNADLRGVLPELLAAIQLAHEGYQKIRVSTKPRALGGREADVIGFKYTAEGSRCLVIEVKGQADSVNELSRQLESLASKLDTLRMRLPQLAEEMDYDGEVVDVSGRFISMAPLDKFTHDFDSVDLWAFDRFVGELKKAGVPKRIIDLLESTSLAEDLDFNSLLGKVQAARDAGSAAERISLAMLFDLEETDSL